MTTRDLERPRARSVYLAASPALQGAAPVAGGSAIALALVGALFAGACNGPRVIHEPPVLVTGQRVSDADGATSASAARAAEEQRAQPPRWSRHRRRTHAAPSPGRAARG